VKPERHKTKLALFETRNYYAALVLVKPERHKTKLALFETRNYYAALVLVKPERRKIELALFDRQLDVVKPERHECHKT